MKEKRIRKVFAIALPVFFLVFSLWGFFATAGAAEGEQAGIVIAQTEQQGGGEKQEGVLTQEGEKAPEAEAESAILQREGVGERAGINLFDGKVRLKACLSLFTMIRAHYISHSNATNSASSRTPVADSPEFHDSHLGVLKPMITVEALIHFLERPSLVVNLQSYFKYYYEAAPDLDHKAGSNIASWMRYTDYQTPRADWDEWINELYFDIYSGPWNIRAGKQVVFWSEVEMVQTVDKINPIDLRYTTPGIEPWDEIKIGLWMIRILYNSNLPGDLIFEHILIPGDIQYTKTPIDGTAMGGLPAPNPALGPGGIRQMMDDWWMGDRPGPNVKWFEYAFRVRGNSTLHLWDYHTFDWTISYFSTFTDSPLCVDDLTAVNQTIGSLAARRGNGKQGSKNRPGSPFYGEAFTAKYDDFRHIPGTQWLPKRFSVVGGSGQFYDPVTGAVFRGEVAYEIGRPYNSASGTATSGKADGYPTLGPVIHRDSFNYGLTIYRPTRWSWLQQQGWGRYRPTGIFELTLGFFQGYLLGGHKEHVWKQWGYNQEHETNFTLLAQTKIQGPFDTFLNLRSQYNTRNWGSVAPAVRFMITGEFSIETGFIWMFAHDPTVATDSTAEDKDFGYVRIKYEF